jgi:uncharacterized protein with PQ loop repeat
MGNPIDYAPIAAAAFAIPQFLPQIRKLRATDDTAGVSWSWATLTSVNNAAWLAYFALSGYWAALVPSCSAALLAAALATMLARRGRARARPAVPIGGWAGLGTLLTAAFVLQVTRRSGPPTEPRTPPGSHAEPGCSSWVSCPAGRSSASTRPTHA